MTKMIRRILQLLPTPEAWEAKLIALLCIDQAIYLRKKANKLPFLIIFWFTFVL